MRFSFGLAKSVGVEPTGSPIYTITCLTLQHILYVRYVVVAVSRIFGRKSVE